MKYSVIPGLRQEAHPGMTVLDCFVAALANDSGTRPVNPPRS
jgi:hypothetical protein